MVAGHQEVRKLDNSHGDAIWSLSWSQGDLIAGSIEGIVKLWDIKKGEAKFTSNKAKTGVTSIVTLQDGSMACACYQDSTIRFFDLIHKTEKECIDPGLIEAYSLSLSPGEDILVSGSNQGVINIWSMQEGHEKVASLPTDSKFIFSTAFSMDGKLATSSIDGLVNIFDMNTQQIIHRIEEHALPVRSVVFSPEGDMLYSASDDRQVNLFDIRLGRSIHSFSLEGMVYTVDPSPDCRHFIAGCSDGKVSLFDLGMRRRVKKFEYHNDLVWSVAFDKSDAEGSRFASAGDDASIHIFEQAPIHK